MKAIERHLSLIGAILTISGSVASIVVYFWNANAAVVSGCILVFMLFVVLIAAWGKSLFKPPQGQSTLYTFLKDDLLPNRVKQFLGLKTDIVIIEAQDEQTFLESLHRQLPEMKDLEITSFQNMPEVKVVVFPNMPELRLILFICDCSDQLLQEGRLTDILSGAGAVIVVRTVALEKKEWVYAALERWAVKNSHAPCLVIDKIDPKQLPLLKLSPIPERYFFIPDDIVSLPWRLSKRGNDRAFAWRNQASFNRLMGMSGIFLTVLLLTGLGIGCFWVLKQKSDSEASSSGLRTTSANLLNGSLERQRLDNLASLKHSYDTSHNPQLLEVIFGGIVSQTRDDYQRIFMNETKDDSLHFSYWVNYGGTLYQLATTEKKKRVDLTTFPNNKTSIIGCAFAYQNSLVTKDDTAAPPVISPFNEATNPAGNQCQYQSISDAKVKFIACSSYDPSPDKNLAKTVGLCVFTLNENHNILKYAHTEFLKTRTREFYEFVVQTIMDKKLVKPWREPN